MEDWLLGALQAIRRQYLARKREEFGGCVDCTECQYTLKLRFLGILESQHSSPSVSELEVSGEESGEESDSD